MTRPWPLSPLLLCLVAPAAPAAEAPVPLRQLCVESPLVVLATPVDPAVPTRFRVTQVLRSAGARPAVGDVLAPEGLDPAKVRTITRTSDRPRTRAIEQALLFLEPRDGGRAWRLRPTG